MVLLRRKWLVVSLLVVAAARGAQATNFKTVCASGCDYTDLQSAINAVPTRSTPGDGASSPWVIQVQIGVFAVGTSLTVDSKSYVTIEGVASSGTFLQATSGWFANATGAPAEQFLTISNSDHVVLKDIAIDVVTNAPTNLTFNQTGGGIAGLFLQHANPVSIDGISITAYEWAIRDANPAANQSANANYVEINNSRFTSQYVTGWLTGGSTWLVWNSEFEAIAELTANTPPGLVESLYVLGAQPTARNIFTAWGCHFHGEASTGGTIRGVDVTTPGATDVIDFVGSTLHAKSTATSSSTLASPEALYILGSTGSVDISGSELIYEGLPSATSGIYTGIFNNATHVVVNVTGSSIIDRARDDSTNPPTLAGSTHKDVARSQGAGGTYPSTVHIIGSRATSMSGHSSSVAQSLDTVETQAGTATLSAGTYTVTLPATLPSNKYRVALSVGANETVWVSSKTATGFTINSSNGTSTASVDWIVRY